MGIRFTQGGSISELVERKAKKQIDIKLAEVMREVVPLTPVGKSIKGRTEKNSLVRKGLARTRKGYTGGRLKKGWLVLPAENKGNGIVIGYLYNSVHYAPHVNYGHRTRFGMSRKASTELYNKDGTPKKRYIEGQFFLEKALRQSGIKVDNKARFKKK